MIELIEDLKEICEYLYEETGNPSQDEDYLDMKEAIEQYLYADYQKFMLGVDKFLRLKMEILNKNRRKEYELAYSNVICGLSDFSIYLDDFCILIYKNDEKKILPERKVIRKENMNYVNDNVKQIDIRDTVTIKAIVKKLQSICINLHKEMYVENKEFYIMNDTINQNLDDDYNKLLLGIQGFQNLKMNALNKENNSEYEQAYSNIMYGLETFIVYFREFHKFIFKANKKRMLLEGEITQEEYDASDVLEIEYVDDIDEEYD